MFKSKYFSAQEALECTASNAMEYAYTEIRKAMKDGKTKCYVNNNHTRIPIGVVKALIISGYNIYFQNYEHDDNWFFQADWSDAACGRIYYKKNTLKGYQEISCDEFVSIAKDGNNAAYIVENVSNEEKNLLSEHNINFVNIEDENISVEKFDDYINALIVLGRFESKY